VGAWARGSWSLSPDLWSLSPDLWWLVEDLKQVVESLSLSGFAMADPTAKIGNPDVVESWQKTPRASFKR
jgi:hypothetical protein